jgi:hypothetical protein
VQYIGKIDISKYQSITCNKIITDEVILTDNRKEHIIERRGKNFYDEYSSLFSDIVADPDYIFKDRNENTALVAKKVSSNGAAVNIVLRLAVEGENSEHKNSIITAVKESDKRFVQRLRNNVPIYQRLDKSE